MSPVDVEFRMPVLKMEGSESHVSVGTGSILLKPTGAVALQGVAPVVPTNAEPFIALTQDSTPVDGAIVAEMYCMAEGAVMVPLTVAVPVNTTISPGLKVSVLLSVVALLANVLQ